MNLKEYIKERKSYLKNKQKHWPEDSSVHKCAEARLHELRQLEEALNGENSDGQRIDGRYYYSEHGIW